MWKSINRLFIALIALGLLVQPGKTEYPSVSFYSLALAMAALPVSPASVPADVNLTPEELTVTFKNPEEDATVYESAEKIATGSESSNEMATDLETSEQVDTDLETTENDIEKMTCCDQLKQRPCCCSGTESCSCGEYSNAAEKLLEFTTAGVADASGVVSPPLTGAAVISTSLDGSPDASETIVAPVFQLDNGTLKFVFHEISDTGIRVLSAGNITGSELLKAVMRNIGPKELVTLLDESVVLEVFRRYKNVYDYSD